VRTRSGRVCREHRDRVFPEGTALQLVLKTITTAQQEIRLMGYSFTSPEVAGALVGQNAGRGCESGSGPQSQYRRAQQGQPCRHESAGQRGYSGPDGGYLQNPARQSDRIADGRNTEVGSFNFSRAADRANSENVLVVWDDPVVAQRYLQHWSSRWSKGTDWKQTY
jgi:phosphatidylserine/phosphatidylglycerophosphate/cardiolipin synthase-like enzyme